MAGRERRPVRPTLCSAGKGLGSRATPTHLAAAGQTVPQHVNDEQLLVMYSGQRLRGSSSVSSRMLMMMNW